MIMKQITTFHTISKKSWTDNTFVLKTSKLNDNQQYNLYTIHKPYKTNSFNLKLIKKIRFCIPWSKEFIFNFLILSFSTTVTDFLTKTNNKNYFLNKNVIQSYKSGLHSRMQFSIFQSWVFLRINYLLRFYFSWLRPFIFKRNTFIIKTKLLFRWN